MGALLNWLRVTLAAVRFGARYAWRARTAQASALDRLRGELLRDLLLSLGPAWIKLGQILATRSDLLRPELLDALRPLQDDVPAMPADRARALLREAYGGLGPFAEFDDRPIAAGSVAQVHRATLTDGTRVALKLLRPGIRAALDRNVDILLVVARAAAFFRPALRSYQITERVADLRPLLLNQADLAREAGEMAAIRHNFRNHPFVEVPQVFEEHCRPDVLVMEFADGQPWRADACAELPRKLLARRLVDAFQTMIYLHGRFHADAHPGNLLFSPAGKLTLLDFGLVGEIDEAERWALASFYYAVIRKEWAIAARRYTDAFAVNRTGIDSNWPAFEAEMTQCLKTHFETRLRWNTAEFTHDTVRIFESYGARESTRWVQIELALVSLEGFVAQLDPELDLWEASRKFNERYSLYLDADTRVTFEDGFARSIPQSLAAAANAKHRLVAPTHLDRYFVPSAFPLFVAEAKGSRIVDLDGNSYLDLHGGYGPFVLGFAHPAVEAAIREAVASGNVCALATREEAELMDVLVAALPGAEKGLFANSGTEACLTAMKLCRAATGRRRIAKCEGHYHGYSDQGTVSSWFRVDGPVDRPRAIAGSAGADPAAAASTLVVQYGHGEALRQLRESAHELACVILEPLPASMIAYDADWLRAVRAICSETGVPLVFDEVVTGFRVAYGGMQTIVGVRPDLTVLGKVIGGGLPCGAVVGRADLVDAGRSTGDPFRDYEERAFVGGTFAGNRLTCVAGLAQLKVLREEPAIYSRLDGATGALVAALRASVLEAGLACQVSGFRSMFTLSFRNAPPRHYRERFSGSDVRANIALTYLMRFAGVYMPELHTYFIGAAHSDEDIEAIAGAFAGSLARMKELGFD